MKAVGALLVGLVTVPALAFGLMFEVADQKATTCDRGTLTAPSTTVSTSYPDLSEEQRNVVNMIIDIGAQRGDLSERDIEIGLVTARQESGYRILNYGDRDSLSIFQQRPSIKNRDGTHYWGSPEQIMDPVYTINRFYDELVRKVPNRDELRHTVAAQLVQVSAFPEAYQRWVPEAKAILAASNVRQAAESTEVNVRTVAIGRPSCSQGEDVSANTATVRGNAVSADQVSDDTWVMPIRDNYRFTSGFGMRWGKLHDGIDMAAPVGTPLYFAANGVIVEKRPAPGGGWGNTLVVETADGTSYRYAHMNRFADGLEVGDQVFANQRAGEVGNTGFSTGPHLHYSVYRPDGSPTDPVPFLSSRGLRV